MVNEQAPLEIPIIFQNQGVQDLNWITPDMIECIEVVRGSMSSLYCPDAMGGVINIITRKIPAVWRRSNVKLYSTYNFLEARLISANRSAGLLMDTTNSSSMQKLHTIVNLAANYDYSENLTFRGGLTNLLDKKLANGGSDYMVERQQVFAGLTYKY